MKVKNIPTTIEIYNLLLKIYSLSDNTCAARALITEMKSNELEPDENAFTIRMHSHIRSNDVKEVENVIDKMLKAGIEPSLIHYNMLMKAYIMASYFEKAKELLLQLGKNPKKLPDIHICTLMLNVYYAEGGIKAAEKELHIMMNKYRVTPGKFTEYTMLKFYSQVGGCRAAEMKVEEIINNYSVNSKVLLFLMLSYTNAGEIKKAGQVLSRMKKLGLVPDITHYNALIEYYSNRSDVNMIKKLLNRMLYGDLKQKGIEPNQQTYVHLSKTYFRSGLLKEAESVTIKACRQGLYPDGKAFFSLMGYCRNANQKSIAMNILRNMPKEVLPSLLRTAHTGTIENFINQALVDAQIILPGH